MKDKIVFLTTLIICSGQLFSAQKSVACVCLDAPQDLRYDAAERKALFDFANTPLGEAIIHHDKGATLLHMRGKEDFEILLAQQFAIELELVPMIKVLEDELVRRGILGSE